MKGKIRLQKICPLRAQLVSLNAPKARDLVVTLRAPFSLSLALCARPYILRIHISLFIVI